MHDFMNRINAFWRRGLGAGSAGSGQVAKSRLQVVLVHDRAGISPRVLASFRKDLVAAIGKYFEIDADALEIDVRQVDDYHALLVNTPIIRAKAAAR